MNLQSIERLQDLLGRIGRNAKLPHRRTQGFAAFVVATPGPATAQADSKGMPAVDTAVSLPPDMAVSLPPESLPAELLEVDVSPPPPVRQAPPQVGEAKAQFGAPRAQLPSDSAWAQPPSESSKPRLEIVTEEPELEDVSFDDISAVELSAPEMRAGVVPSEDEDVRDLAGEVTVEPKSAVTSGAPGEPVRAPVVPSVTPYTAPPSLDELTFSEPPPPNLPAVEEIEPPPISAAHAVSEAPDSIDAALLAATEAHSEAQDAFDSEAPAQTPPPESGPQVAVPPMAAPSVPTRIAGDASARRGALPTAEQLGDVIDLDQGFGPPLELDEPPKSEPKRAPEELEFVPRSPQPSTPTDTREPIQTLVGGFTEELGTAPSEPVPMRMVVPSAQAARAAPVAPAVTTAPVTPQPGVFGDEAPTASSLLAPEVTARPAVAMARSIVEVTAAARAYRPRSFLELLDASLGLYEK